MLCGFCKQVVPCTHDTLRCWYRHHRQAMAQFTRQVELEKLESWWALPTQEESC